MLEETYRIGSIVVLTAVRMHNAGIFAGFATEGTNSQKQCIINKIKLILDKATILFGTERSRHRLCDTPFSVSSLL